MGLLSHLISLFVSKVVISVVLCNKEYHKISYCPMKKDAVILRDYHLGCQNKGVHYHCLRTASGGFIEFCQKSIALDEKDGCPFVRIMNNIPQMDQGKCSGSSFLCPDQLSNRSFSSADAYKYPGCFRDKENLTEQSTLHSRVQHRTLQGNGDTQGVETDLDHATKPIDRIDNDGDKPFESRNDSTLLLGIIGLGVAIILLTLIGFLFRYIKKLKMGEMRYMTSVPYNSGTAHMYHDVDNMYDDIAEPEQAVVGENDICTQIIKSDIDIRTSADRQSNNYEKVMEINEEYLEPVVTNFASKKN